MCAFSRPASDAGFHSELQSCSGCNSELLLTFEKPSQSLSWARLQPLGSAHRWSFLCSSACFNWDTCRSSSTETNESRQTWQPLPHVITHFDLTIGLLYKKDNYKKVTFLQENWGLSRIHWDYFHYLWPSPDWLITAFVLRRVDCSTAFFDYYNRKTTILGVLPKSSLYRALNAFSAELLTVWCLSTTRRSADFKKTVFLLHFCFSLLYSFLSFSWLDLSYFYFGKF